jgi:hypothetical protein
MKNMKTFDITVTKKANKQRAILGKFRYYRQSGDVFTIFGVYGKRKRVIDVFRYTINIHNYYATHPPVSAFGNILKFHDKPIKYSNNPKIVLIIESPHMDEYHPIKFSPIAPAQGATGNNIYIYICSLINNANGLNLPNGDYDIIICNPVQFQSSLFNFHKTNLYKNSPAQAIRDKSWRAIYAKEKVNFFNRLKLYAPKAIINACTAKLRKDLEQDIETWANSPNTIATIGIINRYWANKHPCIWDTNNVILNPSIP